MIQLTENYVEYLMQYPEKGMGYQVVDVYLTSGEKLLNEIVLNSQFLKVDNLTINDIENILIKI